MVVAAQLRSLAAAELAYPYDAFLDVLNETAVARGCAADLRWSAERALDRVRSGNDDSMGGLD